MRIRSVVHFPLIFLLPLLSQAQDTAISIKPTEIAPGFFMLEGDGGFVGGNMSLTIGEDGVILIDDGLQPFAPTLLAAIRKLTGEPVDYVVNTHVHGDHTGANAALHETGATLFAHDNIRKRLFEDGITSASGQVAAPRGMLPEITFSDSVTIHLNGRRAFVFHVAAAHTDGDAVIHYPDLNVVHAGDVFFNRLFPFIDLDSGGSVDGYLAAQEKVLGIADDDTAIIPGHGALANKADLTAARDMLVDARASVASLVDAGMSEEQVLEENPLSSYHDEWNWGFITTERMTRTLYRSLTYGR